MTRGTPSATGTSTVTINVANDLTDPAQTLTIVVEPASQQPSGGEPSGLAFTGSNLRLPLAAGTVLFGLGLALLASARRRRTRSIPPAR